MGVVSLNPIAILTGISRSTVINPVGLSFTNKEMTGEG